MTLWTKPTGEIVHGYRKTTRQIPAGVRVQPLMHASEATMLLEMLASPKIVRDVEQLLVRGFYWLETPLEFDEAGQEIGTMWELRYRNKSAGLVVSFMRDSYAFTIQDLFDETFQKYFNRDMLVRRANWEIR